MKTDDLIAMLASDPAPVASGAPSKRLALGLLAGAVLAALAMQLTLGVRPDIAQAIGQPGFWGKLIFPTLLAGAGFVTLARLARPGMRARAGEVAMLLLVGGLWAMAVSAWAGAAPPDRAALVWGTTWRACTLNIVLLSVPVFAATVLALRQLAPTRLAEAGACAGALSGAAGAAIYAFHCPETGLPFMAVWYVAAIALVAGLGAVLGRRLLRW